eukprot:1145561-Pelagomonas_calceolata.AAC.13
MSLKNKLLLLWNAGILVASRRWRDLGLRLNTLSKVHAGKLKMAWVRTVRPACTVRPPCTEVSLHSRTAYTDRPACTVRPACKARPTHTVVSLSADSQTSLHKRATLGPLSKNL